jgi:putative salt-induced outer membrane protein YdiY
MFTTWILLTPADVLAQFNDSETAAYDAAKGDTQSASLPAIITLVVNQIWHAYHDGGRLVDFAAPGTVPAGEKNRAIALARWKYLLALPTGRSLQTDERRKAHDDAETYFLQIAQRKIPHAGTVNLARPGRHLNTRSFDSLGQT